MSTFNFAPLWRSTVGFDRLFDMLDNEAFAMSGEPGFPPFDIERTGENAYEVTLAVAGFSPEEITITAEQNVLTVEGHKAEERERQFLHHGISARQFRRQFSLADHVNVTGAVHDNGLVRISLVREVPEAMKPRRIEIANGVTGRKLVDRPKVA